MSIFSRKAPPPPDWWYSSFKQSTGIVDTKNKAVSMKLKVGSYYPFVMKNGKSTHPCVGLVCKSGISVTNMSCFYQKEDVLWVGSEIKIDFPEDCQYL